MIPDKIYIHTKDNPLEITFSEVEEKDTTNIPYVRKEALVEWAKWQKKETEDLIKEHPKDDSLWAEMHWYERLINHIESL